MSISMPRWGQAKPAPASFPPTKVCKGCGKEKPRAAFGIKVTHADNRDTKCKECRSTRATSLYRARRARTKKA